MAESAGMKLPKKVLKWRLFQIDELTTGTQGVIIIFIRTFLNQFLKLVHFCDNCQTYLYQFKKPSYL